MTALQLLAWINAALILQFGAGIGLAVWLRRRAAIAGTPQAPGAVAEPAAQAAGRDFRVAGREFEDEAQMQCSFYLEPTDGIPLPPFKPGQYLTFSLRLADPTAEGGARTVTRCYSLSDRPSPTHYRVTIKRVLAPPDRPEWPPGLSSNHFHDRVRVGDVLQVKAPSGHFHIDPDPGVPAVLIAGGIGITPMMSMLLWCLDEQPDRPVHLYYGLRHGAEHAFKPQLEQLAAARPNFHLHVVYSRPGSDDVQGRDFQHAGHVDVGLLRLTLPHGRHRFYVCGPAAMMRTLVPALAQWGVSQQDIHCEAFGPACVPAAAPRPAPPRQVLAMPVAVQFRRAGRTLTWDGTDANLLELAERHGVEVASGCRCGSCGSCETRLVAGRVHYVQAPDHDITPGHCLLCVGTPQTAVVLEA